MTIGERIKAARKAAGMTQRELAERMGLSPQTVAQWENDLRNPKFQTLKRIAGALNISAYDLLDQEEARATSTIVSIMEMEHILLDVFSNLEQIRIKFTGMAPKEINDGAMYGYTFSNSVGFLSRFLKIFLESMPRAPGVQLCFRRDIMLNEAGLEKLYSEYCELLIDDSCEFITSIGDYEDTGPLTDDDLPF